MADVLGNCTGSSKLANNTSFEPVPYSGAILVFGVVGGVKLIVMYCTSSADTTEPDEPALCMLSRRLRREYASWSGIELFDRLEPRSRLLQAQKHDSITVVWFWRTVWVELTFSICFLWVHWWCRALHFHGWIARVHTCVAVCPDHLLHSLVAIWLSMYYRHTRQSRSCRNVAERNACEGVRCRVNVLPTPSILCVYEAIFALIFQFITHTPNFLSVPFILTLCVRHFHNHLYDRKCDPIVLDWSPSSPYTRRP